MAKSGRSDPYSSAFVIHLDISSDKEEDGDNIEEGCHNDDFLDDEDMVVGEDDGDPDEGKKIILREIRSLKLLFNFTQGFAHFTISIPVILRKRYPVTTFNTSPV